MDEVNQPHWLSEVPAGPKVGGNSFGWPIHQPHPQVADELKQQLPRWKRPVFLELRLFVSQIIIVFSTPY